MPISITLFAIEFLRMIGIPPISGFVSNWYRGIETYNAWVIAVLMTVISIPVTGHLAS
jgi:formate hydrogenlyase subunit 3/multisubunit Na+/H+ antiporter MnhD subunit